ncbi:MAG: DNA methyltransferase [Actinomycetota bacterium]
MKETVINFDVRKGSMKTQFVNKSETESSTSRIISYFNSLTFDESWTFEGYTQKDTTYITHGYHRYPAKFIPQLANRLIRELSSSGDLVVDPFMGSGTALVEAKVLGRPSVGVDINPVAALIAKAKVTAIEPSVLDSYFTDLVRKLRNFKDKESSKREPALFELIQEESAPEGPAHKRIDYWFTPQSKEELGVIYSEIKKIDNEDVRTFLLCGFSHILKNCSIWLMKSTKPTRDFKKIIPNAYDTFIRRAKIMVHKNTDFWQLLKANSTLEIPSIPLCEDARTVPAEDNSVTLVVTSPPYVTSYEYADLHQLTALWFEYAHEVAEFRKIFIGSAHNGKEQILIDSEIGEEAVTNLRENKTGKDAEVATYFSEMRECFKEMHRYLKLGGKACIVIGNTAFKKIDVPNAQVFAEQMENLGFRIHKVIKRLIPSKILPQTRDPLTGRFTASSNHNKTLAYPYEYILIMEKG